MPSILDTKKNGVRLTLSMPQNLRENGMLDTQVVLLFKDVVGVQNILIIKHTIKGFGHMVFLKKSF